MSINVEILGRVRANGRTKIGVIAARLTPILRAMISRLLSSGRMPAKKPRHSLRRKRSFLKGSDWDRGGAPDLSNQLATYWIT
jgi:hypothetical protein